MFRILRAILEPMEPKRNKKAYFDYEHLETFEAGIQLTGSEVKSVKTGLINLEGSYIVLNNGEALLKSAKIARYPKASPEQTAYDPERPKRLLLTKKELNHLAAAVNTPGLTIVPLFMYISKRLVKVKIALARGKRKFDKRAAIKEKEYKRRLNSRVR